MKQFFRSFLFFFSSSSARVKMAADAPKRNFEKFESLCADVFSIQGGRVHDGAHGQQGLDVFHTYLIVGVKIIDIKHQSRFRHTARNTQNKKTQYVGGVAGQGFLRVVATVASVT